MQNIIAGLVLCIISLIIVLFPRKVWELTEKWKSGAPEPIRAYFIVTRAVCAVFAAVGILLLTGVTA